MDFFNDFMMKNPPQNWHWYVHFMLLEQKLTQWWRPVVSRKATNLLHWAMRAVLYQRIATAIKMASKVGAFFYRCCFACNPGNRRGNTEQVFA
jgi:hypothetical protein